MRNRLLFCNIGWMRNYHGVTETDQIIGGGKYVITNNTGGEIYNFQSFKGTCYGYVQPVTRSESVSDGSININRLGAKNTDDYIDNIDVVLIAFRPNFGTVVIGWYKNATVYREKQINPHIIFKDIQNNQFGYRFKAKAKDTTLLDIDRRYLKVPRAGRKGIRGGLGQSNVWFADNLESHDFLNKVIQLIDTNSSPESFKKTKIVDIEKNRIIELKAIQVTTEYFVNLGYSVTSVETQNLGWDLEATLEEIKLKIEVKGLSNLAINAGLTPNEYSQMKKPTNRDSYRISIVSGCLTKNPNLSIFSYNKASESWIDHFGNQLKVKEIIAANIFI